MNITKTSYTDKMVASQELFDILRMLIKVQNEGKCTVFFDLAGHCELLSVRIHVPQWEADAEPLFSKTAYIQKNDEGRGSVFNLRKDVSDFINSLV
jgi:hypothetical protein